MKGNVYLVGAGPGDMKLITVKGLELIQKADVIVYDQLVNKKLLEASKDSCEKIYVGKIAGNHAMAQEEMNQLLVDLAKKHSVVVRLKGGDPYVFGRGSEEGEVLYEAGVPFEVVPGITSPIGGLAYAGIPITSRGIATSFHVITGHISEGTQSIDFRHLAQIKGTLVFLMGMGNLSHIVKGLIEGGKDQKTPAAIIYRATTPYQKVVVGTLETIETISAEAKMTSPSLIVVGEVINHRNALNFFESRPLFGKKIMVTRSRSNASKLSNALEELGAMVKEVPTIQTVPINENQLETTLRNMTAFNVVVFTSGVAVSTFFEKMMAMELDGRILHNCKFIVIGLETSKTLKSYGYYPDEMPEIYTKDGLSELLTEVISKDDHILVPRSAKGDPRWIENLSLTYKVTELHLYDTVFLDSNENLVRELLDAPVDYITFTSSSTAIGLKEQLGDAYKEITDKALICAIGPTTRATLEAQKTRVDLQPDDYTIKDMIACIVSDVTKEA